MGEGSVDERRVGWERRGWLSWCGYDGSSDMMLVG